MPHAAARRRRSGGVEGCLIGLLLTSDFLSSSLPFLQPADKEHDFGAFFLEQAQEGKNRDTERNAENPPWPDIVNRLSRVADHRDKRDQRERAAEKQERLHAKGDADERADDR